MPLEVERAGVAACAPLVDGCADHPPLRKWTHTRTQQHPPPSRLLAGYLYQHYRMPSDSGVLPGRRSFFELFPETELRQEGRQGKVARRDRHERPCLAVPYFDDSLEDFRPVVE